MRQPYNVIFRFHAPMEGGLTLEADSKEHAIEIATKLVQDRYKDAEIIEAYPISESPASQEQNEHTIN